MDLNLNGKRALVTGGTGGLGLSIANVLTEEGASVALLCRNAEKGEEAAASLRLKVPGAEIHVVPGDLGFNDTLEAAVGTCAERLGGLDILVNAAGGAVRGYLDEVSAEDWEARFEVKPFGLIAACRFAVPYLENSEQGRIINIGGLHGREPNAWTLMGSAINASVLAITKALSLQLGKKGITVNSVHPGFMATRRWDELIERTAKERNVAPAEAEEWLLDMVPLHRAVSPRNVADLVAFLASDRAEMITGAAINVDGGRTKSI